MKVGKSTAVLGDQADSPFPVGGPRQAVFDALTQRQFTMCKGLGDKQWERADGYRAHVYGAGSKLQLTRDRKIIADGPVAEVFAKIDEIEHQRANAG